MSVRQLATAARVNPAPLLFPFLRGSKNHVLLCLLGQPLQSWWAAEVGFVAIREARSGTALPAARINASLSYRLGLPLCQPMKPSVPQFPLLQESSEIAIAKIFFFVYSECQQN